jgi:hypothetical protein
VRPASLQVSGVPHRPRGRVGGLRGPPPVLHLRVASGGVGDLRVLPSSSGTRPTRIVLLQSLLRRWNSVLEVRLRDGEGKSIAGSGRLLLVEERRRRWVLAVYGLRP